MRNLGLSFKNHRLYSDFIQVKSRLQAHQFVCWVAGGAVRDLYLGRDVYDFDLVTDAATEALKVIFPEAVLVGESFGVLKIPLANGEMFDLASFRQESDYADGRRPSAVRSSTPLEDARRRDFTINALFWDDENQRLIDFTDGVHDLNEKILACVGSPQIRFTEDHLRIVRLIRFQTQLHFQISASTEQAASQLVGKVTQVSGERIWGELKKMARARNWNFTLRSPLFNELIKLTFNGEILLENFKKHNISAVEGFELEVLLFIFQNLSVSIEQTRKVLTSRLKLSKAEISIFDLIHFALTEVTAKSKFEVAMMIEKRDGLKSTLYFLAQLDFFTPSLLSECEKLLAEYPVAVLSGRDLMSILKGPEIGLALDEIRLLQLQGQVKSKEEALLAVSRVFSKD